VTQSKAELLWSERELTTKVRNNLGLSLYAVPQSIVTCVSQTSFDHISTNSLTILMASTAMESP